MNELWRRFKRRHWDQKLDDRPGIIGIDTPRFRRCMQWFARLWREQPLALLATAAGMVGAIAALIRVLR